MTDFHLIPRTPAARLRYLVEQLSSVRAPGSAGQTRLIAARMVLEQVAEELEAAPESPLPVRPDGDRCSTCGVLVEPYGMVLHHRAVHASAEQLAEDGPRTVGSLVWTVTTTVTAPTPEDAERWAGMLRDLQLGEHGEHMRLDITVAPVVPETPGAAFQRRQLERGLAMLYGGDDAPVGIATPGSTPLPTPATAEADVECGFVRDRWDGPYRMRDRCTGPAGHATSWTAEGHGPWEMLADAPASVTGAATGEEQQ